MTSSHDIPRSPSCGAIWLAAVLLSTLSLPAMAQKTETGFIDRSVTVEGLRVPYQVYVPSNYRSSEKWPVILFLHGSGERGMDGLLQTTVGLPPAIRTNPARYPAIVVMPQAPPDSSWTGRPAAAALAALDATMKAYNTDDDRVYLTGLSMGGHGVWYIAYRNPERFAAIAPVCGWVSKLPRFPQRAAVVPAADGEPFAALAKRLGSLPTWIFHGELDGAVPVDESRQAAAALDIVSDQVRYTEFLGTNHNSWDPTYASVAFTDWLFAQKRSR